MAAFNRMVTYTWRVTRDGFAIVSADGTIARKLSARCVADLVADGFMESAADTIGLTMTANSRGWTRPGSAIVAD